ncbi:hypothetical protein QTN25_004159 [Entamoeba marina]
MRQTDTIRIILIAFPALYAIGQTVAACVATTAGVVIAGTVATVGVVGAAGAGAAAVGYGIYRHKKNKERTD